MHARADLECHQKCHALLKHRRHYKKEDGQYVHHEALIVKDRRQNQPTGNRRWMRMHGADESDSALQSCSSSRLRPSAIFSCHVIDHVLDLN